MAQITGETTTPPFTEPGDVVLMFVPDYSLPMDHVQDAYAFLDRIRARHNLPPIELRFWARAAGPVRFEECFTRTIPAGASPTNQAFMLGFTPRALPWTPDELAALDVLRGASRGAVVTDTLEADDGTTTSQTVVMTEHGAVVLTSWVPESDLPESKRALVHHIAARVRHRLNLRVVRILYFGPPRFVDGGEILVHEVNQAHPSFGSMAEPGMQRVTAGMTSPVIPWTIMLHAYLSGDELERTIAHELRHAWQLWGRAEHVPESEREADAMAFADTWMSAR